MTAYIVKRDVRAEITDLSYEITHGINGKFTDKNGMTDMNDIYDILLLDKYSSKLIEGCHNSFIRQNAYAFNAIRIKDL